MSEEIKRMAENIASDILELGNDPRSTAHRIAFIGRDSRQEEIQQGGLCETALANFIEKSILKHKQGEGL